MCMFHVCDFFFQDWSCTGHELLYRGPTLKRFRLASFALEEYETALEAFRRGQQAARAHIAGENSDDPRKYRTWIRKCEAEMEAEDDVDNDASKSNGANEGGSEAAAPTASTSSTSAAPMGTSSESSSTGAPTAVAVNRESVSAAPIHLRTKFQYYQSHEKVTVSLLEKGLKEADVEVDIGTKKLTVRRRHDLALLFDKPLYEDVLPEKHKTKFLPSKASIGDLLPVRSSFPSSNINRMLRASFLRPRNITLMRE